MNISSFLRALLRMLFVVLVAYPTVWLWLGIHVRHRARLPVRGPAILAANHNSHLDILTLLTLFPLLDIPRVQPAAAADYFFKAWWLRWFTKYCIGIIPVMRGTAQQGGPDPLAACYEALAAGNILIIFPEGTRGQPEEMGELKTGIWYLAQRFPQVPVVPIYMHGLGRSMPKGAFLPVPLQVQVAIGKPLAFSADKAGYMQRLREHFAWLRQKIYIPVMDDE